MAALNVTIMRKVRFLNFSQPRETSRTRTKLGNSLCLILQATEFRLIAAIHYNRNKIYIRHVLARQEYDAGKWKE